jgi:hypothetical protein
MPITRSVLVKSDAVLWPAIPVGFSVADRDDYRRLSNYNAHQKIGYVFRSLIIDHSESHFSSRVSLICSTTYFRLSPSGTDSDLVFDIVDRGGNSEPLAKQTTFNVVAFL